jgi:hypothetical protein
VSALKLESKLSKGKLYVYDNRKDSAEYKALVSELRCRFASVVAVRFIERIDEYNNDTRAGRDFDHTIIMSQYSFLNLSRYFLKYNSFVLFTD